MCEDQIEYLRETHITHYEREESFGMKSRGKTCIEEQAVFYHSFPVSSQYLFAILFLAFASLLLPSHKTIYQYFN